MSTTIIPILCVILLITALLKRVDVYEAFVEGAMEALPVLLRVLPYMAAMLITIQMLRESGLIELLTAVVKKPLEKAGMPPELLPLALLRPLSGSASLAVVADLLSAHGPDSFIGMTACTMVGASETIFYTMAVYLGAAGVKKTRFVVPLALAANGISVIASIVICRIFFV